MTRFRAAALGAVLLALALPSAAYAGTTLGSAPTPTGGTCLSSRDLVQVTRADGTSARVPTSGGVITSWSFRAGDQPAAVALRAYRPGAGAGSFTLTAESGPVQQVAGGSGLVTFPTRVKVWGDEYLGLRTESQVVGSCFSTSAGQAVLAQSTGPAATETGATVSTVGLAGAEASFSAVLEPDRDNDGYGDETQDACPRYPTIQAPCPDPDTVLLSRPRKSDRSPVATIRFASTLPGAFFMCRLDGESVDDCTSPARFRCLEPGKHRFRAYAVIDKFTMDPTPLKVRFRVPADRRGCRG